MKLLALVTVFAGVAVLALAQDAPAPAGSGLKVSDIQEMVKGGLSEDLVIAALRKENHPFELGGMEMVQLKKDGVSDNIIKVMLDPRASVSAVAPASSAMGIVPGMITTAKPSGATPSAGTIDDAAHLNDPAAKHDSGIYLFSSGANNQNVMTPLERAATAGTKTGVLGAAFHIRHRERKDQSGCSRTSCQYPIERDEACFLFLF